MRRRSKILRVMLVLAIMLLGSVSVAQASFWVKGLGFYYSPAYGDLKNELDRVSPYFDVAEELEPGTGFGLSVGYHLSNDWVARLDIFSLQGRAEFRHLKLPETYTFETSTRPIVFSIVRGVFSKGSLHSYLGAGLGSFSSELRILSDIGGNQFERIYRDSPLGFQILAGIEYSLTKNIFLSGEVKYLFAEADYPGYKGLTNCSTDWSGPLIGFAVGWGFGV